VSIETIFACACGERSTLEPQRAVLRLVVDELPLSGEQPVILETLDGLPAPNRILREEYSSSLSFAFLKRIGRGFSGFSGLDNSARHSGMRAAQTRNLEIPGSRFACPGMTGCCTACLLCKRQATHPSSCRTASTTPRCSSVSRLRRHGVADVVAWIDRPALMQAARLKRARPR